MTASNAEPSRSGYAPKASRVLSTHPDGVTVMTFDPLWRSEFKRLNVAWLQRYFTVEAIDERVLGDPETEILAPGGDILFAILDGQVVGTVALKVEDAISFELTKMAVDERWLGKGYGQRLLEAAIKLARELGKRRLVLYSQTALKPAINLYYKNGFVQSPEPLDGKYARCDIKMELVLRGSDGA